MEKRTVLDRATCTSSRVEDLRGFAWYFVRQDNTRPFWRESLGQSLQAGGVSICVRGVADRKVQSYDTELCGEFSPGSTAPLSSIYPPHSGIASSAALEHTRCLSAMIRRARLCISSPNFRRSAVGHVWSIKRKVLSAGCLSSPKCTWW
jgi:hypothetical protein